MTYPMSMPEVSAIERCRKCGREPEFIEVVPDAYVATVHHVNGCEEQTE